MSDHDLIQLFVHKFRQRHREVLELACLGMQNEEIGAVLDIESSSVAGYLTEIYGLVYTLERFRDADIKRPLVISVFAPFFDRHPELRSQQVRRLLRLIKPSWLRVLGEETDSSDQIGKPPKRIPPSRNGVPS